MRNLKWTAVFIALAGLAACERPAPRSQNSNEAAEAAAFDRIVDVSALEGTGLWVAQVGANGRSGKFSSGYGREIYDIWLIDQETAAARSLLEPGSGRVTNTQFGYPKSTQFADDERNYKAIQDAVAAAGEDQENAATSGDQPSFYLIETETEDGMRALYSGQLAGGATTVLLKSARAIVRIQFLDPQRFAVLAQNEGGTRLMIYDVATLSLIAEHPVAVRR